MGHFFDQFVPAGVDPGLFVVVVIAVVLFVAGVVFLVVGRLDEPEQTTLPPLEHPPPRGPRVVPGPAIQRHWENYLRAYHARGGLGSPLVQLPDEASRDAWLRDAPQAAPSGSPLASAAEAKGEQAPSLPPNAAPLLRPAPGTAGLSHPPLPPFPVASEPALPPRPAGSVPLAFQPGGSSGSESAPLLAPGFDEEAAAGSEAAEPAEADEENETDRWASSRPWVILPSRFPVDPPTEGRPAASARPEEERPAALTTFSPHVGLEPAEIASLAAEADASAVSARSDDEARLSPTTVPSRVEVDAPPALAKDTAPSSPPEAEDASTLLTLAGEEVELPERPRQETAEAAPAPLTVRSAEPEGLSLAGEAGRLPLAEPARLAIHGFGEAHLIVKGQVVPMRKASKALELVLYLAHQAALHQAPGKEIPYSYRETVADALWPLQPEAGLQRQSLSNTKLKLSKRLQAQDPALEEADWLETGQGQGAVRLHASVGSDLATFVRLAQRLGQTRQEDAARHPQAQDVGTWVDTLHSLYQGGFALQFREEEWVQSARARYQRQYHDALFDGARLLARLGHLGQAILLAKDLLLEDDVPAALILPALLAWLEQDGGSAAVASWQEEYQRRYFYKFQRPLAQDRPDQEALFRQALDSARR